MARGHRAGGQPPGGEGRDGGGEVVGGVEPERDRDGGPAAVGRGEQVGGAQDQQGRGQVADLERGERAEEPAELAV